MMKDLFRHKDKLKQVLDKAAVFIARMTIANAKAAGTRSSSSPSTGRPTPS
jgi:hypothetical protein